MWEHAVDAALSHYGKLTTLMHNAASAGARRRLVAEFHPQGMGGRAGGHAERPLAGLQSTVCPR